MFYRCRGDEFDEEEAVWSFVRGDRLEEGADTYRKALRVTDWTEAGLAGADTMATTNKRTAP